jgi:LmbE family N-acetylglucosaminyl deacetylase
VSQPVRMVVYFAHPDDESFGFAGSLAMLADQGADLTYICATRGDVGEILVEGLTTPENLGQYRVGELRRALDIIGVQNLRVLGYRDSGMDGTAENQDQRAFVQQDVQTVASRVADIIVEKQPEIFLFYGPDGIYGHPDHKFINTTGVPAIQFAAERGWQIPHVYCSAASRERIRRMADRPGNPFSEMTPEQLATFGTPAAEITTWIDTRSVTDRKLKAIRAHRTQVGDNGPFADLDPDILQMFLSIESCRLIPTAWNPNPDDLLLKLLPEAPLDHPFRGSPTPITVPQP